MLKSILYSLISLGLLSGCATLQNNAKYDLAEGRYVLKLKNKKFDCYVENNADSLVIYNIKSKISTVIPLKMNVYLPVNHRLVKPSFDIDILTTLFKIRPQIDNVLPTQLNTNFNGNIYVGYRTDVYQISYHKNPIDKFRRQINHFGFSGGFFMGLGSTAMTPSTTNNILVSEYDGVALQKGIAGIMAVNKLTIGLSIGFDTLLDKNRDSWIYQNKPWFGLMLGLNLN